jgi:RNA polymerase sigma-70 factor (ECF subfamily)
MFKVYCKASQVRDRKAFRGWLFKIANNALCEHYGKQTRELETVTLEDIQVSTGHRPPGGHAFEFLHWMAFLDSREREVMKLRFLENWEYHEIAAAQNIPIGTVQWRVFNAKKKLASHLTARPERLRRPPELRYAARINRQIQSAGCDPGQQDRSARHRI